MSHAPIPNLMIHVLSVVLALGAGFPLTAGARTIAPSESPGAALPRQDAASAKSEVARAFERLAVARSYRAATEGNEASGQEHLQIEYVAPDRARISTRDGVQTIVGSDMHMQVEGQSIRQTVPAGVLDALLGQWKLAAQMLELPSTRVEAIGSERIDGRDTPGYRVSNAEMDGGTAVVWISEGYPVRIDMHGEGSPGSSELVSMHYSHINDPDLRVDLPGR